MKARMVVIAAVAAWTADPSAQTPSSIDTARYVTVGGIEQWITIRGSERSNPAILFLHGGPGDALSPFSERLLATWEQHFTLVQWDQPGAGRTFSATGPSISEDLSIQRIVGDGVAVTELVLNELEDDKLILLGASWGSVIGIAMARARPDLFHAYVGVSQVVSMQRAIAESYPRVHELLERAGAAVDALEAIGQQAVDGAELPLEPS